MSESEPPGSIARELVESLGVWISNSEVSRVCALRDEQVDAVRQRPFEGRYRYLFVDATAADQLLGATVWCHSAASSCYCKS